MPLQISQRVSIPDREIELSGIRAQGAGGQNVNKVSSAIHLRFDIGRSSLPDFYKQRLLALHDTRISKDGVITLKAQRFRTRERNREDALARLAALIRGVAKMRKRRIPTQPTRASKERRIESKKRRSRHKQLRGRVRIDD